MIDSLIQQTCIEPCYIQAVAMLGTRTARRNKAQSQLSKNIWASGGKPEMKKVSEVKYHRCYSMHQEGRGGAATSLGDDGRKLEMLKLCNTYI